MERQISVSIGIIESGVELTEDSLGEAGAIDNAAYQRLLAVANRVGELLQAAKAVIK